MAGETRAAAEAVAELSRGSVGRGGRHGIESVTDVLLSFQSARRSFGDLATVVDRDHVPLRTAVMLTGHERHALTSWFNPEIAADELRYGARRSRLALAYFCGRAATFVPDELHEGGDAAGISGVRRKPAPYVTLPLAHGGRVAGVVQFGCRCALTDHDLAFFDALARWLGILVSRARRTRPVVMAEVALSGAGRQYQIIIRDAAFRAGCLVAHPYLAARGVYIRHFGQQHVGIALAPQDVADGRGDVGGREICSRHLIEQWLKDIMVVAVNDGDVSRGLAQLQRRLQPAEARADDHHTRYPGGLLPGKTIPMLGGRDVYSLFHGIPHFPLPPQIIG